MYEFFAGNYSNQFYYIIVLSVGLSVMPWGVFDFQREIFQDTKFEIFLFEIQFLEYRSIVRNTNDCRKSALTENKVILLLYRLRERESEGEREKKRERGEGVGELLFFFLINYFGLRAGLVRSH